MTKHPKTIEEMKFKEETAADLALYSAVGRAIVLWGRLEVNFSYCVARLYHYHGGKNLTKEPPFGMDRKIKLWNKCFQSIESLGDMQKRALRFSSHLARLKSHRDELLHFARDLADAQEIMKGRSLKADATGHNQLEINLRMRSLNAFSKNVRALETHLLPLSLYIVFGPRPK